MATPPFQRVLHVDDQQDIRGIVGLALGKIGGFTVKGCPSGEEALAEAAAFAPDLLLLDKEHLQDASLPIILTEGEFKTLALWRLAYHGDRKAPLFLPIGIGGVWNWRGTVGKDVDAKGKRVDVKGPIPDLDRIFWKGRKIAIAFDADADTKDTVQHARNSLVKELQGRGALVGVLQWDTNVYKNAKGIDDLLAAAGPDVVIKHWGAVIYKARTSTDDSAFRLTKNCVLYVGNDNSRPVKVCGRLEVVADTRSTDSVNWGRLIRWEDPHGRKHEWAMPLSLLHSDGSEIRQKLAYEGLPIVPGPRNYALLTQYLAEAPTGQPSHMCRSHWLAW